MLPSRVESIRSPARVRRAPLRATEARPSAFASCSRMCPLRRKFLKSADAEFRSIVTIVSSYALPLPSRAFRVEHNGRTVVDLPPVPTMRDRVVQIVGNESAQYLEEIEMTIDRVHTSGFVTRGLRFGSRRNQFFLRQRTPGKRSRADARRQSCADASISTAIPPSSSSSESSRSLST